VILCQAPTVHLEHPVLAQQASLSCSSICRAAVCLMAQRYIMQCLHEATGHCGMM
jgi:hypothetical protein